jgi:formylglycine-generating enzyme required for sulfatase activity
VPRRSLVLLLAALPLCAQSPDRLLQLIQPRKQVALVIGNAAYANFPPLANPVNDAQAMAQRLRELDFDVTAVNNADRRTMLRAVDQFVGKLRDGDVALFYYAGHGVQAGGENYLIPADFQGQDEVDIRSDALSAGKIQEQMERSGAQLNILVLDACRTPPFRGGSRAATGGLATMSPARGTLIAFATSPGRTASDNPGGKNGLFTTHLLEALSVRGLALKEVFERVQERVDSASQGKQLPWVLSSVFGRYYFVPGEAKAASPPVVSSKSQPGEVRVNPKDGQTYVWIPPGTFRMGCSLGDSECADREEPAHEIAITKGFWLGQTPVTQTAYEHVTGKNPSKFKGANLPVDFIVWKEARAYCEAIGGRLPTEAEWEYAARAGTTSPRYAELGEVAWYSENSGGTTHEVAQKRPNAFGLYDMLGNVMQWTADWFGEKYYEQSDRQDPAGPAVGRLRTMRGGSLRKVAKSVRASSRSSVDPLTTNEECSVRCVADFADSAPPRNRE